MAKSDDGELWVMLLEKAWAKLHGSYGRTTIGWSSHPSMHLTGNPAYKLTHSEYEPDEIWNRLKSFDLKNYSMTSLSNYDSQGDISSSHGVVYSHVYALIDVYEIHHQGEDIRLVKMRNPWGNKEWEGDWSDNSDKWTRQLKD